MAPPVEIGQLVQRFDEQRDDYRCPRYNETLLRQDFLNPFFAALGWDVHNQQGFSEAFREVVHEYTIRVRGGTQTVDYSFQIGREPIFLVEAKKPAVDIRHDAGPAYQLRNYGWNLKLPVSILTDFEEFAVYDCRQRPKPTDKASVGRVTYLTFDQYPDHFD